MFFLIFFLFGIIYFLFYKCLKEKAEKDKYHKFLKSMLIDLPENIISNPNNLLSYKIPNYIIDRFMNEQNISKEQAELYFKAFLEFVYCQYLLKKKEKSSQLPMTSKMVDTAWHTFILFSREYTLFCFTTLGYYLNHQPNIEKEKKETRQKNSILLSKSIDLFYFEFKRLPLFITISDELNKNFNFKFWEEFLDKNYGKTKHYNWLLFLFLLTEGNSIIISDSNLMQFEQYVEKLRKNNEVATSNSVCSGCGTGVISSCISCSSDGGSCCGCGGD